MCNIVQTNDSSVGVVCTDQSTRTACLQGSTETSLWLKITAGWEGWKAPKISRKYMQTKQQSPLIKGALCLVQINIFCSPFLHNL